MRVLLAALKAGAIGVALALSTACATAGAQPVHWGSAVLDQDPAWYASAEARSLADSVLAYQSAEGGWPKNTDLAQPVPPEGVPAERSNTFDNNGTTLPMEFLARVIHGGDARYVPAFMRGLEYVLVAQYENGGWPQFYPLRGGYYDHVTFNDDAMIRVMELLRDIAAGEAPYSFVDPEHRTRAAAAVERGLALILRTQIRRGGVLTGWCAQYDERTLAPAWARAYEPPSISGYESIAIVRFLMTIEHPSPEVIAAVEGAVAWLREAAIEGIRLETFTDAEGQRDRRVIADPSAPPLWARFYEIESNRPLFLGRDSVFHYAFAEIERERRAGYNYYGPWAARLLAEEHPRWRARVGAGSR